MTIFVLLSTGHRLCNSLLSEARLALVDADWLVVDECLHEATIRLDRHMRAEESVLFPRLAALAPEDDAALTECRYEHEVIRARMRATLEASGRHDKVCCAQALSHLIDLVYAHCLAEERRVYALTHGLGDEVLVALAQALSKPIPPVSDSAASRRLH